MVEPTGQQNTFLVKENVLTYAILPSLNYKPLCSHDLVNSSFHHLRPSWAIDFGLLSNSAALRPLCLWYSGFFHISTCQVLRAGILLFCVEKHLRTSSWTPVVLSEFVWFGRLLLTGIGLAYYWTPPEQVNILLEVVLCPKWSPASCLFRSSD